MTNVDTCHKRSLEVDLISCYDFGFEPVVVTISISQTTQFCPIFVRASEPLCGFLTRQKDYCLPPWTVAWPRKNRAPTFVFNRQRRTGLIRPFFFQFQLDQLAVAIVRLEARNTECVTLSILWFVNIRMY